MDNELKAFEEFLTEGSRTAYPNPSRHGCPPQEFLKNLAKHRIPIEETAAYIDHLRSCSECFLDYTRFSETISREKRRMRFIALGSIAALLCVVVVGEYVILRTLPIMERKLGSWQLYIWKTYRLSAGRMGRAVGIESQTLNEDC